ncbi:unnamed protein product [Urochloa humidicola]
MQSSWGAALPLRHECLNPNPFLRRGRSPRRPPTAPTPPSIRRCDTLGLLHAPSVPAAAVHLHLPHCSSLQSPVETRAIGSYPFWIYHVPMLSASDKPVH